MTDLRWRYFRSAVGVAGGLAIALAIVALIEPFGKGDPAGRFVNSGPSRESATAPATGARGEAAVMSLHDSPRAMPKIQFKDGDGQLVNLIDFRGKLVLLNIWATWCGPCRKEMPTLDRLQAELGGPEFRVVALSIDRAGLRAVSAFYDEIGVQHLARYVDESGKAARELNAVGLPTTLLIDRDGREIARHVGPAEWNTPELVEFFRHQLGRQSGALWPEPAGGGGCTRARDPAVPSAPRRSLRAARLPTPGHTTSSAITEGNSS